MTITGTQTDAGSSANVASAAVIKKGDVDVTSNYEITYTDGTLTVTKATSNTVTVAIEGWTYGDTAKTPTSTATFGTVSYTYSATLNGTYSETVPSTAGTWYVKANVAETTNYVGGSATQEFTIAQKALTITADSDTKAYDGTDLTKNSYPSDGLVQGDSISSVTLTGTQTHAGTSANKASEAVIVNATGADVTDNYSVTYVDGTLTVTQAQTNAVNVSITGSKYGLAIG